MDILSLLACFQPLVAAATMRHFSLIVPALLTMTGLADFTRPLAAGGSD
jgi:hypothetical protein